MAAMALLLGFSALFSASEAALFVLRPRDRRAMKRGSAAERAADRLLDDPERLLSAILFWNLLINTAYFALASIAAIRLERADDVSDAWAIAFGTASLFLLTDI
jgi:Mg2+/Co2+ transporter CorB